MTTFNYPTSYPYTTTFIQHDLASIAKFKPRVFRHFKESTGMNDKDAKDILTYGFEPRVAAKDIPQTYGYTPPTPPNEIWLKDTFLDELDPLLRVDNRYVELQARATLLLEAVVMHELVHYGRKKLHGAMVFYGARRRAIEEDTAQQFERAAYGMVATANSLGLAQFMPKTAWSPIIR